MEHMSHAELVEDFFSFIEASPSSYHAAAEVARRLDAAGFARESLVDGLSLTATGGHYLVDGGAVIAWYVPESLDPARASYHIVGSHTDSPGFKLKAANQFNSHGFTQASVEVYGGPLIGTWFDREIALAGRVLLKDGSLHLVKTDALFRIPNLAIHLIRSNTFEPDLQRHTQPIFALEADHADLMSIIAESIGVEGSDIIAHDLITINTQAPARFGVGGQFVASGRLDNLSSVHPSLVAFLHAAGKAQNPNAVTVFAAFDHEEVGSQSTTGAGGPLLDNVLKGLAAGAGLDVNATNAVFDCSQMISADAAHSVHPNYAEKHDPIQQPVLGSGPVLKLNANQRYATDAASSYPWLQACAAAGVTTQYFNGNNNSPCGSTIGPISATRLGIRTVDVGIPLLSMHSSRETCHVADLAEMVEVLGAFYQS